MQTTIARLIATTVIAVSAAGCSDKAAEENKRKAELYDSAQLAAARAQAAATVREENLKACFQAAAKKRSDSVEYEWQKAGCKREHPEQMTTTELVWCNQIPELADRDRKDEEDRCVKLYK